MRIHAVHTLYDYRLSQSTRPFLARGGSINRCKHCMLLPYLCLCEIKQTVSSQSAFLLLMYDDEILKPSNTGRLIADLIDDTYAYIWSRTKPQAEMLNLLRDTKWMPIVVFPSEYAEVNRQIIEQATLPELIQNKRPLFILLDGTWAQAKKMFRKSPYLNNFPVLSFSPEKLSEYLVRKATKDNQLATAEVASLVLASLKEFENAEIMHLLFNTFKENYLLGKGRHPLPENSQQALLSLALNKLT
ncbi:DTW domain-containing protein [Psychromonas sp. B3M02]|uniref:tRNA-uridine aminocarboxypropyltransferase n=1 Tax=Psychromonas sp. B3M02 TaxID=2267226 RepID=UPI000DE96E81|nr:tRNA-uridine aminocarboxypropyltransferase [Psychromonas sp. B3M02]RBW47081.1 DTW domain-containing protein [Psychromonas sp. B3M02]